MSAHSLSGFAYRRPFVTPSAHDDMTCRNTVVTAVVEALVVAVEESVVVADDVKLVDCVVAVVVCVVVPDRLAVVVAVVVWVEYAQLSNLPSR